VVKPGDVVRVKVLDVDVPRKRISLTLRLEDDATPGRRTDRDGAASSERAGSRVDRGGSDRGGSDRGGSDRGGRSGRAAGGRDGGRGGGREGARGGRQGSAPDTALAEALRRAGLAP
jgi:protein Tex